MARDPVKRKAARARFAASSKGKAVRAKYDASAKRKAGNLRRSAKYRASAKGKENVANRKELHVSHINSIKLQKGCMDCGFRSDPEALDFDHIPGFKKCFNIGHGKNQPWPKIEAEIAKCEVVCKICHAKRTRIRRSQPPVHPQESDEYLPLFDGLP